MGYALEMDCESEDLDALLVRIERLCADVRLRQQCLALVGSARLNAAQLERVLGQLERPTA